MHSYWRPSSRCGKYLPVVKMDVPVDGRFEHVVLSCNATMDHTIVWTEREGQKALDDSIQHHHRLNGEEKGFIIPAKPSTSGEHHHGDGDQQDGERRHVCVHQLGFFDPIACPRHPFCGLSTNSDPQILLVRPGGCCRPLQRQWCVALLLVPTRRPDCCSVTLGLTHMTAFSAITT